MMRSLWIVSAALLLVSCSPPHSVGHGGQDGKVTVHSLNVWTADVAAMGNQLQKYWANRELHERAEGFVTSDRIAGFQADLQSRPPVNDQEFYVRMKAFLVGFYDGHLRGVFANAYGSVLSTGMSFEWSAEGLTLTSCRDHCENLALPALVTAVDGFPVEGWLIGQASHSPGSTKAGRRKAAGYTLSRQLLLEGEPAPPTVLTLQQSNGQSTDFSLPWRRVKLVPNSEPCVSGQTRGPAFVLRVRTFDCIDPAAPKDLGAGNAMFARQLAASLALAGDYQMIVVDVRGNGGGYPTQSGPVISAFVSDQTLLYFAYLLLKPTVSQFATYVYPTTASDAAAVNLRQKPLWLLTDGGCFSECSIFVTALKDKGRAKIIGAAPDAGAGGWMPWSVPSKLWQVSVPAWKITRQNGQYVEEADLSPDIPTLPEWKDLQASEDVTLDQAIQAALVGH